MKINREFKNNIESSSDILVETTNRDSTPIRNLRCAPLNNSIQENSVSTLPGKEQNRKWHKTDQVTSLPNYYFYQGAVANEFQSSKTDIFMKLLGTVIDDTTYQSNLYLHRKKLLRLEKTGVISIYWTKCL